MYENIKNLPSCTAHDKLGEILTKIKTSHEPIFVFDNSTFLGLISPYNALFVHRYPHTTNAIHCAIKAPSITLDTSLFDTASYMMETKLYSLPVFDEENHIIRVISISEIFKYILNTNGVLQEITKHVSLHKPLTASVHSSVKDIYSLMRKKKVGKIVLVDEHNHLSGIVSRYDIHIPYEEFINKQESPVLNYATLRVLTVRHSMPIAQIIKRLLVSKHSCIVITKQNIPVGFLSRHDILKAFTELKFHTQIPVQWTKHTANFNEYQLQNAYALLDRFLEKFDKQFPIQRAEIHIDQAKNSVGYSKKLITIKLHILLKSGKLLLSQAQDWRLLFCIKKTIKKLIHESEMSDRQKNMLSYAKQHGI